MRALIVLPKDHDERAVKALKKVAANHQRRRSVSLSAVERLDLEDWPIHEILRDIVYKDAGAVALGGKPVLFAIYS